MEKECGPNNHLNTDKILNSKENRKLQTAQEPQEEAERTSKLVDQEIQRVSQTVIDTNQETTGALIQRTDSDNNSDVTASGDTQLSHEDALRQIECLKTQLKKKQEEHESEIAGLQAERDSLRLKVKTLQEALSKEQDHDFIQKPTMQLTNLECALHEKNMALDEAHITLTTKRQENDSLQAERDNLILEVRNLESTLHQNNMALEEAKGKAKSNEQKNDSLQAERDNLTLQVRNLESALNEKEAELQNALSKGKTLGDEKDDLMSSGENLTTAFRTQQEDTEEALSNLTELNQELTRQKAIAETSEQELKSARDTTQMIVQQRDSKFAAVLTEKQNTEKKVQNLKLVHRHKLSALQSSEEEKQLALQRKQRALSTELEAAQRNSDILLRQKRELEETLRIKQEQIEAMEKKKKKKRTWFRRCFCC